MGISNSRSHRRSDTEDRKTVTDLFNYGERYPNRPGHKRGGTSREAAAKVWPWAGTVAREVLDWLRSSGPATPDECAAALKKTVLAVRPRFSELAGKGLIQEQTGHRRRNDSGLMARVYRAKQDKTET